MAIDRTKQAAKTVAEKLASKSGNTTAATSTPTPTATDNHIPGLLAVTPELVPGMMPAFKPEQFHVADPLNPPASLPQATQAQFDKGMKIYEGATRALKLIGSSLDFTREKFTVINKHAKAFGAGIQAATEIEKVRGNYLDYHSQKEITSQKAVTLDVNQVQTITDTNISVFTKDELTQKLKQSEIKAEETRLKTIEAEGKLTSFKAQLGDYLGAGR